MSKTWKWIVVVVVALVALGAAGGWYLYRQVTAPGTPIALEPAQRERAEAVVAALKAGEFDGVVAMLAPSVKDKLGAGEIQTLWETLPKQLGGPPVIGPARGEAIGSAQFVAYRLDYPHMALDLRISLDPNGAVDGLRIVPAARKFVAAAPVDPSAPFFERDIEFSATGGPSLPATLAMPKGDGPFPSAVLVAGSGPNDRDSTIGPNKPLADIARALAGNGIATLRYDKRTFVAPEEFAGKRYTIDDEVTDDALAAVAALRAIDGVDPERVFVIGHSLGAMLAPRIAERDPSIAGLVLMAAPALPLDEKILMQTRFLAGRDGRTDDAEQRQIAALEAERNQVRALGEADAASDRIVLGLPASYWLSLNGYDPVAAAATLTQPMLLLTGDRDYQVDANDRKRWDARFADDPRVTKLRYPELNHVFMAGSGAPNPEEYMTSGNVDRRVTFDIATWINRPR